MEIQNKVGRDLAQGFLDKFESIHKNDPEKIKIFKNIKLYKFFINKNPNFERSIRNVATAKIILPFELVTLVEAGIINQETSNNLIKMLASSNEGDHTIVEGCIDMYRKKRLRSK